MKVLISFDKFNTTIQGKYFGFMSSNCCNFRLHLLLILSDESSSFLCTRIFLLLKPHQEKVSFLTCNQQSLISAQSDLNLHYLQRASSKLFFFNFLCGHLSCFWSTCVLISMIQKRAMLKITKIIKVFYWFLVILNLLGHNLLSLKLKFRNQYFWYTCVLHRRLLSHMGKLSLAKEPFDLELSDWI